MRKSPDLRWSLSRQPTASSNINAGSDSDHVTRIAFHLSHSRPNCGHHDKDAATKAAKVALVCTDTVFDTSNSLHFLIPFKVSRGLTK